MRIPLYRLCRGGAIILLLALLGWVEAPRPSLAEIAGPPPGYARIWIYRYYEPYVSLATPYVRFNGQIVGVSEPGGAFYRDVAPGEYYVTVDSEGRDVYQFVHVAAVSGQTLYIQVEASKYWDCDGGSSKGGAGWCRDTFYTRLQPPGVGAPAVASLETYSRG
jgi:hypothetical protein